MSFDETYVGNLNNLSEEEKKQLGFNQSTEHADIISTADRTVTAYLENGSEVVIYKKGKFMI